MKKSTTTPKDRIHLEIGSHHPIDGRLFRLAAILGDMAVLEETRTLKPVAVSLDHLRDAYRDRHADMIDRSGKSGRKHSHGAVISFQDRLKAMAQVERSLLALRREVRQGIMAWELSHGVDRGVADGKEPDPRAA